MKKIFILSVAVLATFSMNAAILQVKEGEDLQETLNRANKGDTVLVQAGTFHGGFLMPEQVRVMGGWDETFTTQTQYGTILDGKVPGEEDYWNHVLDMTRDHTAPAIWSNFTIQNGRGGDGGGAWLWYGGRLEDCLIQNNTGADGGGVCYDCGDDIDWVVLDRCVLRNNHATKTSGAMWMKGTVQNCILEENTSDGAAAAATLNPGRMINCIVRNNKSNSDFGSVRGCGHSQMINLLVYGNEAVGEVGGLSTEDALSDFINCTVVGNKEGAAGKVTAGININREYEDNGAIFANNVVWGNYNGESVASQQINDNIVAYKTNYANNAIQGTVAMPAFALADDNTAAAGPHFVDPANADYHFTWQSPLFNAGAAEYVTAALDLDATDRIKADSVDLGCYELKGFQLTVAAFDNVTATLEGKTLEAGTIWFGENATPTLVVNPQVGYSVVVSVDGQVLTAMTENTYVLPAITKAMALTIETKATTALRDIKDLVKTRKAMVNGQIFVIKNGIFYNILGSQVQ